MRVKDYVSAASSIGQNYCKLPCARIEFYADDRREILGLHFEPC